jgi:hypothetical protein
VGSIPIARYAESPRKAFRGLRKSEERNVIENRRQQFRAVGEPAAVAQLVERFLGKDEVMGSSPISSFFSAASNREA